MFTTNKRLEGSLSGSIVLLTTPTGQTDWLWKSTFTLPSNTTQKAYILCIYVRFGQEIH